jgi:hypothetical protein
LLKMIRKKYGVELVAVRSTIVVPRAPSGGFGMVIAATGHVKKITADSTAVAGVKIDSLIVAIGGQPVVGKPEIVRAIQTSPAGADVEFTFETMQPPPTSALTAFHALGTEVAPEREPAPESELQLDRVSEPDQKPELAVLEPESVQMSPIDPTAKLSDTVAPLQRVDPRTSAAIPREDNADAETSGAALNRLNLQLYIL